MALPSAPGDANLEVHEACCDAHQAALLLTTALDPGPQTTGGSPAGARVALHDAPRNAYQGVLFKGLRCGRVQAPHAAAACQGHVARGLLGGLQQAAA